MSRASVYRMGTLLAILCAASLSPGGAAGGRGATALAANDQVHAGEWERFGQRRVVFGHQSVGQNIVEGLVSLARDARVSVPIVESRGAGAGPGLAHFRVGRNGDPQSKLADFAAALEAGAGEGSDVALVKLCYVDFSAQTDGASVARDYIATLDRLGQRCGRTTFVAVTAPLTTVQGGLKGWVKKLLGRPRDGCVENARRLAFNQVLRERYAPAGLLFDVAAIEAQGAPACRYEGRDIETLAPALTSDGGHLNAAGARLVAASLVRLVANLPARERAQ